MTLSLLFQCSGIFNTNQMFQNDAKASVLEMVNDIKEEFRNILDEVIFSFLENWGF